MKAHCRYILASFFILNLGTALADETTDSIKHSTLDEIVVTGNPNHVVTKGPITTVAIHGTHFERMGTVKNMLANIPGLSDTGNGIIVLGLGRPVYYINGRKLTDENQLSILQASSIKDIQIDRAPGAKYESGVNAVILITTYKTINDYIYLDVDNTLSVRRKVSDFPGINLKAQYEKFLTTLSFAFGTSGSLVKETYFRTIEHKDYTFTRDEQRDLSNRDLSNQVDWSGEYQFNTYNRLGLYYYFSNDDETNKTKGINTLYDQASKSDIDILESGDRTTQLHSFSLVYGFMKDKTKLDISQDIAYNSMRSNNSVFENSESINSENHNKSKSKYDVYTTKIKSEFSLPWAVSVTAGAEFSYVNSKSDLLTTDFANGELLNNIRTNTDEYIPRTYFSVSKRFGRFLVNPAIRYEYTYRKISNTTTDSGESNTYRNKSSNLFPSILLQYFGNTFSSYLQYRRIETQPNFNWLNSGTTYIDSLTYSVCNPNLKSTVRDIVRGGVSFKGFFFGLFYEHFSNPIENIEIQKFPNHNTVNSTWVNTPSYSNFGLMMSYSRSIKRLNIYAQIVSGYPTSKIPTATGFSHNGRIYFDLNLNLFYNINDIFSVYTNYTHQGKRASSVMKQENVDSWNLGANASFFNDRLSIDVQMSDILRRANYNNLSYEYYNVTNGTRGTNDMHGISVTVSYTIFNKEINTNTSRGNSDIFNRIL